MAYLQTSESKSQKIRNDSHSLKWILIHLATLMIQRYIMRQLEDKEFINPWGGSDAKQRQADIPLRSLMGKVILSLKDLQFMSVCYPWRNPPSELRQWKFSGEVIQRHALLWIIVSTLFPSSCQMPFNSCWFTSSLPSCGFRQDSNLGVQGQDCDNPPWSYSWLRGVLGLDSVHRFGLLDSLAQLFQSGNNNQGKTLVCLAKGCSLYGRILLTDIIIHQAIFPKYALCTIQSKSKI